MEIPGSSQPITLTIIMAIISLLSLYTALHSHAQLSVVMATRLTNVCAEPNSESACVAIFGSISIWAWNRAISRFWRAESETQSTMHHVTTTCRNSKSRDHSMSEFELRISVASVSHMIFACRENECCASEFGLELSRVLGRNIRGTLLRKNSRKLQ